MPVRQSANIVRRFCDVADDVTPASSRHLFAHRWRERALTWDTLLVSDDEKPADITAIVLESSSGTGKTTEFEKQVERLRRSGKVALYFEARSIASRVWAELLAGEPPEVQQGWRQHGEVFLFVDALDELHLDNKAPFHVFRELERALAQRGAGGLRLVLSARTLTWTAADGARLLESFPQLQVATTTHDESESDDVDSITATRTRSDPLVRHIRFEPLNREDIRELARSHEASNPDAFVEAFFKHEIGTFLDVRPGDIQWLVGYWKEHASLSDWTHVATWCINNTFRELNPVRQTTRRLTLDKYTLGLERLAAASVLMARPQLSFSDSPSDGVIACEQLFRDWDHSEILELLSSGLFVPKGEVVQLPPGELTHYLAASWFARRHSRERDITRLEDHLLVRVPGYPGRGLPTRYHAIAGWLASLSSDFRPPLTAIAPDVLLHWGDPAQLKFHEVKTALDAMLTLRSPRALGWPTAATLARIARKDLAAWTASRLEAASEPAVRLDLLRLAVAGNYTECAPHALHLAKHASHEAIRRAAVGVVHACGNVQQRVALKPLLDHADQQTMVDIVEALLPDLITASELAAIVSRTPTSRMAAMFGDQCEKLGADTLDTILDALLASFPPPPRSRVFVTDIDATNQSSFVHLVGSALRRRLTLGPSKQIAEVSALVVRSLELADFVRIDNERWPDVLKRVREHGELRRAVLALIINREERHFTQRLVEHATKLIQVEDYDWFLHLVIPNADESAVELPHFPREIIRTSWCELSDEVRTNASSSLAAPILAVLEGLRLRSTQLAQERDLSAQERRAESDRAKEQQRQELRQQLQSRIDRIRTGEDANALFWVWNGTRGPNASGMGKHDDAVLELVGPALAQAFDDGLARFWRTQEPEVRDRSSNRLNLLTVMAIVGVTITVQRGGRMSALSPAEARTAARLATCAINRLPEWTNELHAAHPHVVEQTLREAIMGEWIASVDTHGILLLAERADAPLRQLVIELICELAKDVSPANASTLEHVVNLLLLSPDKARVAAVAERFVRAASMGEATRAQWLRLWMHTAPAGAAVWVQETLRANADIARVLMLELAECFDRDFDRNVQSALFAAESAEAWLPIVLELVDPADDVRHEGTRMLKARDFAESMRNRWLGALANSGTPRSGAVLRKLLRPETTDQRGAVLRQALLQHQIAATNSTAKPWAYKEVLDFEAGIGTTPTSPDTLQSLVLRHIRQIHQSQNGDDFEYPKLFEDADEHLLQRWIAGTLKLIARGQYDVIREPEVQGRKRQDVQASVTGIERIPIEIKPVSRYSQRALQRTLTEQLLGDYMTPQKVTRGVLLLVYNRVRTFQVGAKRQGTFDDLVAELQTFADKLGSDHSKVITVAAISLASEVGVPNAAAPRSTRAKRRKPPKRTKVARTKRKGPRA